MLAPERFPLHERPCRPGTRVLARPPARDALFDKAIEFAQRPSADPTEVVASTPDVRIELPDERWETQARHACLPPQFVAHPAQRLRRHVQIQSPELPAMRMPKEDESVSSHIEHARLLPMQRQRQPRHDAANPRQFTVGPRRGEQHEIIRIPNESAAQFPALHMEAEVPVEQVQIHIRKQGRTYSPNAKGNFQFERVIVGWRGWAVLDWRRK
jgi:hypothetical protein